MSWFLSFFLSGSILASIVGFPVVSNENLVTGNAPQLVILTPQTVLQGDETERFEQTYPLNANGRISVSNVNGSIVVEAWDKNEVKLEAVKIANSKERLSQVQIKVDSKPDYLRVETDYGNWKNGNWNCSGYCRLEVQYKLTVPRGAVLNEIETVNGSVTISNMTNVTKANAVNGSVKATNLRGTAQIETVNGTSEVTFDRLDENSKINLSTVNGRVNLVIPSDADATIKADTVNGSISNEFGLPVRKGKYVGRDLYGKVGNGNVKINLDSVNGGLAIKRKQDGKDLKPVVNLLPVKGDDDNDEDDEDSEDGRTVVVVPKINKSINKSVSKAVQESVKVAEMAPAIAAEALKKAEKAMADNAKEIERAQRDALRANRDLMRANAALNRLNWEEISSNRIEEKSETFPVKGTPKVTIDAKSCSVSVRGWDKSEVQYRITKRVRGMLTPEVGFTVNKTDSEVTIVANVKGHKVKSPSGTYNDTTIEKDKDGDFILLPNNAVKIEVFVPKKSHLRILTDREIRVEGVSGNLDLTGNDGIINVRDSQGKLKIEADDATVRVIGFNGEIVSKTDDGTSFFEGNFDKFSAQAMDGTIILTLPDDANVSLEADAKIQTEGFNLTEFNGDEKRRKIGNGGVTYNLEVGDGEILVRNSKLLKVTN
jgi:hypothetical protein